MLKVASFDIVFQEIPGEVTLALNLSGCPCHCPGCHSQHLWEDIGEEMNAELLSGLLDRYGSMITCVAFMGGDQAPEEVAQWAEYVKRIRNQESGIKTAWYSGRMNMPSVAGPFDYVKIGPYIESLGGLKSEKTNQRLYKRVGDEWQDITSVFRKNRFE
ncbi:MAG: 4Fe-4S cluster-binding domain-containing protein [Paludibacteraceae bacterium]|nr:4Fe-4S cluster-binding domain-containing protein [Paludibacteraceae bacterium]